MMIMVVLVGPYTRFMGSVILPVIAGLLISLKCNKTAPKQKGRRLEVQFEGIGSLQYANYITGPKPNIITDYCKLSFTHI